MTTFLLLFRLRLAGRANLGEPIDDHEAPARLHEATGSTGHARGKIVNLAKRAVGSSTSAVSRLNRQNGRDAAKLGLAALCTIAALSVAMRAELAQIEPAATQVRLHALPGPAQVEVNDPNQPKAVPVQAATRQEPPRSHTQSVNAQKQQVRDCRSRSSTLSRPFNELAVASDGRRTETTQVRQGARPWGPGGIAAWTCSGKAIGNGPFRTLPDRHRR
jgi:hypothetical protein